LDQEWLNQPKLYYTWARHLADARRGVAEAKQRVDVVKAECLRAIQADPAAFEVTKPTVDAINAAVLEQLEYKDAVAEHLELAHRADIIGAAVNALDHRRRALENLVDLHGQNYFATPRAATGNEAAARDRAERRNWNQRTEEE
jgi:hypothetical protein